jgi:hypothetical protein
MSFAAPGLVYTKGPELHLGVFRLQEPAVFLDLSDTTGACAGCAAPGRVSKTGA